MVAKVVSGRVHSAPLQVICSTSSPGKEEITTAPAFAACAAERGDTLQCHDSFSVVLFMVLKNLCFLDGVYVRPFVLSQGFGKLIRQRDGLIKLGFGQVVVQDMW